MLGVEVIERPISNTTYDCDDYFRHYLLIVLYNLDPTVYQR